MEYFIYFNKKSISEELCNEIVYLYEKSKIKFHGETHSGVDKLVKNTLDFDISEILDEENEQNKSFTSEDLFKWKQISDCLKNELKNNLQDYVNNIVNNDNYNVDCDKSQQRFESIKSNEKLYFKTLLVQRYIKGHGEYIYHDDSSIEPNENRFRLLTYIWYLNDIQEGGETEFFGGQIKIKPEKGKLLLFPASWTFPHKGCVPISDNKYIITGWVYSDIVFKEWH